jgi:hypothetical protein
MAASYPDGVKTWTPRTDGVDDVMAADINSIYEEVTALETHAVPKGRKVNGKDLSSDITLTASDIPIVDNGDNFTATHVEGALAELFMSVSNGKTALVSDIEAKGGTVSVSGDIPTFGELSDGIGTIPTGGGGTPVPVSPKDVNFCDYDGTVVASYTLAQAQALSALPTAPDHSNDTIPLTFQAWNYTLEQVNALTEKANIGATYVPTDGKTHLKIRIAAEGRMDVPLRFSQTVANGVTIDWGDGSPTQKLTGTGNRSTTHTYSSAGDYDITLAVESGCVLGLGANSASYCVLGSTGNNGRVYCNMLQEVNVGERVASIGDSAFRYCCSLASITIPNSVTDIGDSAFGYCYSLASITIPNSVADIGGYAFYNCYSLANIAIPNSVTDIGTCAFYNCYGMAVYDFSTHTSVPTLASTNAFTGIPSDCIMRIPSALFATWEDATNWSACANYMVAV